MLLLTDAEFFEGIIGGIGWIIAIYYFRRIQKKTNLALVGIVSWAILWYFRKIAMNLYNNAKKTINMRDYALNYLGNASSINHHVFINILGFSLIYFFIIRHSPTSTTKLMKLSMRDLPLFLFLIRMT